MANYNDLKTAIQQVIRANGNEEITGALLQQSLLSMIDSLGAGYQFMGVATPSTNPGTPDQKVFYLAGAGTYDNFNAINIYPNEVAVLKFDSAWSKQSVPVSPIGNNMAHWATRGSFVFNLDAKKIEVEIPDLCIGCYIGGSYKSLDIPSEIPFGTVDGSLGDLAVVYDSIDETFKIMGANSVSIGRHYILFLFRCKNLVRADSGYTYDFDHLVWTSIEDVYVYENGVKLRPVLKPIYEKLDIIYDLLGLVPLSRSEVRPYSLGGSGEWYGGSGASHVVIPCNAGESIRLTSSSPVEGVNGWYGWLTNEYTIPTRQTPIPYVNGTSRVSLEANKTKTEIAPIGAAYLCLVVVDGGGNTVLWNAVEENDTLGSINKRIVNLDERVSALEESYDNEKIVFFDANRLLNQSTLSFKRHYSSNLPAYRDGNALQSTAIYGNTLFVFRNTGVVDYYAIGSDKTTLTYIGQFVLGSRGSINHCNAAQFDGKITSGDFPYIYISATTKDNFICYVEHFQQANNIITSALKQTIVIGNDIINSLDADFISYGYCNIVQDADFLYAIFPNALYSSRMAVIKLKKPSVALGVTTLSLSDVVATWVYEDLNKFVLQGSKVYGNHLYIPNGGTYTLENYTRGVKVYNTYNGQLEMDVDLVDYTHEEIEDVDVKNDRLYIFTLSGNYYTIK